MKPYLFLLVVAGLSSRPNQVDGACGRSDTLRRAQRDSTAPPDSVHFVAPSVRVAGELSLSTGYYSGYGLETSRMQFMPRTLSGYLTLTTHSGWTLPVQLVGSSQKSHHALSFNQIGASARYKSWLTLHGGFRNVVFSPLTLAGHTFLGAGFELNRGLLRIGAVAGRFKRAINADHTNHQEATFQRNGYSTKLGVGNAHNYLDFILFRATDIPHSVRPDTLTQTVPAQNVVMGISGRLRVRKRLSVEFDAASSVYTADVRPKQSPAALPRRHQYLNWLPNLLTGRPAWQLTTALHTTISYRSQWADVKLKYRRTDPGYQSMGAYYMQSDMENLTAAPSLRLFKKRLNLRTTIGWQRDNLFNQKSTRTDRVIGSVNASYASDKDLSIELAYSNYGLNQRAGYRPLNDTVRLAQNNRSLSGSLFKLWTGKGVIHILTGSASCQLVQDLNPFTADLNQHQHQNYMLSYAFQHLSAQIDLNLSYDHSVTKAVGLSSVYYGPAVNVGKKLLKDKKLGLSLNLIYLKNREIIADMNLCGSVLTTTLNIDYQLSPAHRISANWTNALNRGVQSYTIQQGTIQWSVSL